MGVNLTPIIVRKEVTLEGFRGKTLAMDGNNELYQFLALIRLPDGTPLMDSQGNVTSHLVGLLYRSTRLISDYGIRLVFVFDGKPPELKRGEIRRRREVRERFAREYEEAIAAGRIEEAFAKATMTSVLTRSMLDDTKRLLALLGIPFVQAPGEGEAQAAFMARRGEAWAVGSKDLDSLLFGAPRLARFVTVSGREFLPSKGRFRTLKPELIDAEELLRSLGVTLPGLVDMAILIGTDFNPGIKGVGPKTALKLIRKHGRIEDLPEEIRERVSSHFPEVREIYLNPNVTADYSVSYEAVDEKGLMDFLCGERDFSRERVEAAVQRLKAPGG